MTSNLTELPRIESWRRNRSSASNVGEKLELAPMEMVRPMEPFQNSYHDLKIYADEKDRMVWV